MSKISRQENKARYKTGMYPTQQDFENVFDSYVHKDDIVPAEQVKSGDKTIIQLINELSERTHTHQIADVEGLQDFINEVNNFLGTVDASDETINRWKELESFLQGITDTENLLTLLQQYRQEILSAVEGQYLMQVPDLDAYTDAPDGKIVQYTGPTTDNYRHGFIYEKTVDGGNSIDIPARAYVLHMDLSDDTHNDSDKISRAFLQSLRQYKTPFFRSANAGQIYVHFSGTSFFACFVNDDISAGDTIFYLNQGWDCDPNGRKVISGNKYGFYIEGETRSFCISEEHSVQRFYPYENANGDTLWVLGSQGILTIFDPKTFMSGYVKASSEYVTEATSVSIPGSAAWQPLKVQNVID